MALTDLLCDADPDEALTWLLELRIRVRANPEARAWVDRAIALVAKAQAESDPAQRMRLDREVAQFADDLALRFGAPSRARLN